MRAPSAIAPPSAASVLDALPHGIAVTDATGVIVSTNPRWDRAGPEGDVVAGPVGTDLLAPAARGDATRRAVAEHVADGLARLLDGRGRSFQVQYEVPAIDLDAGTAEPRWFLLSAEPLAGGGLVLTRTETTVHHGVHEVLAELAFHDVLTGLPNRGLLLDRVRMALTRAQRLGSRPLVAFADLDGFKAVNDRFGHEAGDAVLVQAARRLAGAVRDGDTCGRWGGDEFVLVVELGEATAAPRVVQRITEAMAEPFMTPDGSDVHLGLSIGAVVADGSERAEALVAAADRAMYDAKRARRGPVVRA